MLLLEFHDHIPKADVDDEAIVLVNEDQIFQTLVLRLQMRVQLQLRTFQFLTSLLWWKQKLKWEQF
jgi:hypothetical protein